jgi:hypothetical protein
MDYLRRLSRVGRKYIPAGEEIARVRFDYTLPDEVVPKFSEMMREGPCHENLSLAVQIFRRPVRLMPR